MNGNMHLSSSSKFLHSFLTSPDRGCHLSTHFQPSMSSTRLLWVWQHRFSERCTNPLKARFLLNVNADIERWVFAEIDLSDALNRAIKMRRICIRRDAPCHRASACVRVSERVCVCARARVELHICRIQWGSSWTSSSSKHTHKNLPSNQNLPLALTNTQAQRHFWLREV